jgi:hypothetical protein
MSNVQDIKNLLKKIYNKEPFNNIPIFPFDRYYQEKNDILAKKTGTTGENVYIVNKITEYNIDERELYSVLVKFDISPSDITYEERLLRIKYLDILNNIIKKELNDGLTKISKGFNSDDQIILLTNISNINNLLVRFVDLLIYEAKKVDDILYGCPPPIVCPPPSTGCSIM